jgi:hypothetical protein
VCVSYHGLFILFDKWDRASWLILPSTICVVIISSSFSIGQLPLHQADIISLDVVNDTTSMPHRSTILVNLPTWHLCSVETIFHLCWQPNLDDSDDKEVKRWQQRANKVFVRWGNKILSCIWSVFFFFINIYPRMKSYCIDV